MVKSLAEEIFGPEGELAGKASSMPKKKVAKVTGDMGLLDEEQDDEKVIKKEKRKKKLLKAIEKW
jgi:hypothetical protein